MVGRRNCIIVMNKSQLMALSKLATEQSSRIDDLEEKLSELILYVQGMRRENENFDKYLRALNNQDNNG